MKYKIYNSIPWADDLVMFTDMIMDLLKSVGSTHFLKYRGHQLKVQNVTYGIDVLVTFLSVPLGLVDVISMRPNGTVAGPSSKMMATAAVFQSWASGESDISEPRNNDGRTECFWCPGISTQKRGGGSYDICPKCGR